MKINKVIHFFVAGSIMVGLCSCANNLTNSDWNLTKENLGEVLELTLTPSLVDDEKQYVAAHYESFLKGELTKNDIIFFNAHDAYAALANEEYDGEFLDLNLIREYEVEYTDIFTDEDLSQFKIIAPKKTNNKVGVIINKAKTINNNYVIATIDDPVSAVQKTPEELYEEQYGHSAKAKASPIVTGIVGGAASIIGGLIADNGAGLIASGIGQLINVILGSSLTFSEPSIRDVLQKLFVIDYRLQELDRKMTQNFDDLKKQEKLTQSYVNQAILLEYENTINNFETQYMGGVRSYINSFGLKALNRFKELAQGSVNVNIPFYYKEGILAYRPFVETSDNPGDDFVTVNIAQFSKTLAKLATTKNTFNAKVLEKFQEDIYDATVGVYLPPQMTREILSDYVVMRLTEEFVKYYFEGHNNEAIELNSNIIEFCYRFTGLSGTPILTTYLNRLKYMFNFGTEIRGPFNTILANLRMFMRNVVSLAMQASTWAELSCDNLEKAFDGAEGAFVTASKALDDIPDSYSFILQSKVNASLYSTYTESRFTSYGNFPTHYNKLHFYRYYGDDIDNVNEVESNDFHPVAADDHYSLSLRMNNLINTGYVSSGTSYKDYLVSRGILSGSINKLIANGVERKVICNNANQFITSINHREVKDNENIPCYFTDRGRGDMSYFNVYNWYNYKSQHGRQYWHATCWESLMVDVNTGKNETTNTQIIGLEGCYDEGHKYWRIDERYRFNNGPNKYFFLALIYDN